MALSTSSQPPILLRGAPDETIGTPQAKSKAVQVMQLDMTSDVLEELLAYTRQGKTPHIAFGRNPVCIFTLSLDPCVKWDIPGMCMMKEDEGLQWL
jgi:hypothetical protein